jgi:cytochrome c5
MQLEKIHFDRKFRLLSQLTLLLMAAAVLSACGSQPTAAPASAAQAVTSVPTQTEATTSPASTSTPVEASSGALAGAAAPADGTASFSKDVLPLFQTTCVSCHGGERTSSALDLKTYASLMAGSQHGAMVVPGDAANSVLVQKIQAGKMPKRGTKWTSDQLQVLVDWINAGAQNN